MITEFNLTSEASNKMPINTERLEAACRKALSYTASPSYKSIKNILAAGQEKIEPELQTPDSASTQNKHAITRGADYYRR